MYEPSKIITSFHISGFQHHDGVFLLDELKPGKKLAMVAEPDNPYDPSAIVLRYEGTKMGYVPRSENELLAQMMFFGHGGIFEARVQQVNPEADPWKQVRVGIYLVDNR